MRKSKANDEGSIVILFVFFIGFLLGMLLVYFSFIFNLSGMAENNGLQFKDESCLNQENITEIYKYKCNENKFKWKMENMYTGEIEEIKIQTCDEWYYEKEVIIQK